MGEYSSLKYLRKRGNILASALQPFSEARRQWNLLIQTNIWLLYLGWGQIKNCSGLTISYFDTTCCNIMRHIRSSTVDIAQIVVGTGTSWHSQISQKILCRGIQCLRRYKIQSVLNHFNMVTSDTKGMR